MAKNVITISRQFGSGGRTVGRRLAERLGVPFYDKELVNQVADETGFLPLKAFFPLRCPKGYPLCKTDFLCLILFSAYSVRLY